MQFIPHCVRSYLLHVTFSLGNVAHTSKYHNELRDSATDIEKTYQKGASSKSEVIEA